MRAFQRKAKKTEWWYTYPVIIILCLFAFAIGRASFIVFLKEKESGAQRANAESRILSLEQRRSIISEKIDLLKTKSGIEFEIREQFQVAKPGEQMVVVIPEKDIDDKGNMTTERSMVARFFDIFW